MKQLNKEMLILLLLMTTLTVPRELTYAFLGSQLSGTSSAQNKVSNPVDPSTQHKQQAPASSNTLFLPLVSKASSSAAYIEKINSIADYLQTDPAYGGLPGGGLQYCGPTAVSNSIMWLDNNGFNNLVANTQDRKRDQFDVITVLGSPSYMNTSSVDGTGVNQMLIGTKNYILARGYQYIRLQYEGWRYHSPEFATGITIPDMQWINNGVRGNSSVWLNIGWYTYNAESDLYVRTGGHWVTLVGYGYDGYIDNPTYLIVHDPARGSTNGINNYYLLPQVIASGTLTGNYTGLPRSANGYFKIVQGIYLGSPSKAAIIDGAIVLEMPTGVQMPNVLNTSHDHQATGVNEGN
jgi:hypothetical protein